MIFRVIAFVVLALFYGCYFLKMISQRQKGIQTDQMGKGKKGFVKFIEITMKSTACIVPIVEVVSIFLNTTSFPVFVRVIGSCVSVVGVIVFLISVLTMRDNWRAGVAEKDQTELVTGGIYRISRNPAFLGFDLVYIGIVLMFFNWVLFVVSVFAAIMFHLQIINVEEEYLSASFGEEYLSYRKKVCRYLGRMR